MAGGFLVIGMTLLIGTYDYNGAGTEMIAKAIEGSVPAYAFLLKMLLTALTLAAGYKGGEIVPAFLQERHLDACLDMFWNFAVSLCGNRNACPVLWRNELSDRLYAHRI